MTKKDCDRFHMVCRFEAEWSEAVDEAREHQRETAPMLADAVNWYYYQHGKRIYRERYPTKISTKWIR